MVTTRRNTNTNPDPDPDTDTEAEAVPTRSRPLRGREVRLLGMEHNAPGNEPRCLPDMDLSFQKQKVYTKEDMEPASWLYLWDKVLRDPAFPDLKKCVHARKHPGQSTEQYSGLDLFLRRKAVFDSPENDILRAAMGYSHWTFIVDLFALPWETIADPDFDVDDRLSLIHI